MKSTSKQNILLGIVAVLLLGGIAWVSLQQVQSGQDSEVKISQTLSPALFEGTTREAYQVAADIPEVLEELPCFCGCMQHNGHKNNLFCFKDAHGAMCGMCVDIALDAKKMHNEGIPVAQIRQRIQEKYNPQPRQ